ncbi:MAG: hypothetical protein ABT940_00490 [Alphaproteobacteria bacterium]
MRDELTRAQLEESLRTDRLFGGTGLDTCFPEILAHDAALRAKVEKLEDWRATVTAALGREGGALFDDVPKHIKGMVSQLATLTAERDELERILYRKGYRKSCDIPACNCGDQWNHGGNAEERLRELHDALPYVNGKTLLTIVKELVADRDRLREQIEALRREAYKLDA